MSNGDQLPLYAASQLPELFAGDANCKFIALKIKREDDNTALHAIYIEQQTASLEFPFGALITVTEWDGKSQREEFFIEAETASLLMEKLQRFDEVNSFVFLQVPSAVTIDTVTMQPQQLFCLLFPELGVFHPEAPDEVNFGLKNSSLALLHRLESRK